MNRRQEREKAIAEQGCGYECGIDYWCSYCSPDYDDDYCYDCLDMPFDELCPTCALIGSTPLRVSLLEALK